MVGRIALRPLLRVLRRARQDNKWAELRWLLKDRLFAKRPAAKNSDPLPPVLFQMATAYWLSQAIYVAAKLGIADFLEKGPRSSFELATVAGCDPSSLFRVLRALSSAGVLSQVEQDGFALTRLGNVLCSNVPGSLRKIVITLGEIHYQACSELLHSVCTGTPAFDRVFGASLFEYLRQNRAAGIAFNQGMSDLSSLLAYAVLLAYDFSEISSIVDIGGGEGELLRNVLELYPEMTGVVFDSCNELRSPGLPNNKKPNNKRPNNKKEDRCSFVAGSFFDSVPERAEAYLLCGVLHDWSDELAGVILCNCRKAVATNGRLLIVDTIVPETNSASFSKLLDLNMMVMTSGRERTKSEFGDLLETAGFRLTQIIPTMAPQSIIEARPR
jgi:O-methyltransferase domain/Dimerisation domain